MEAVVTTRNRSAVLGRRTELVVMVILAVLSMVRKLRGKGTRTPVTRGVMARSSKLPFGDMAHIGLSYDFDLEISPGSVFGF